ncbi:MAG TPA: DUF58 domain-containing protein [Tepidisphaeraceae bacterium]|jgi:uncharacterized protein (DUF58 family)|nr:DUF58 domain-containing protein [Tepidisphaeraceae bacterium]
MPDPLLSAEAAARVKRLELFARSRVENHLKGAHRSRLKGHSTDFLQHRPYLPGDDIRALDWRVYARSDRLVIREREEFTALDVNIVLDCSASMNFASGAMTKFEFSRHCAALLAYLVINQRDRVGVAFASDRINRFIKSGGGNKHLAEVFRQLLACEPAGQTDLAACTRQLLQFAEKRSLFLFFSDCYQDPAALGRSLGILARAKHDVIVYQVYDPAEADLPYNGFTLFRDVETGRIDPADPQEIRTAYLEAFRRHARELKSTAMSYGVEFHPLPVTANWESALAQLLHERATLA